MRSLLLTVITWACISHVSFGMNFEVVSTNGEPSIFARGAIAEGDAKKLERILTPDAKNSFGFFAIFLSGPGGDVIEAFKISQVIDRHNVYTYIPPGNECVSACAAIVFIAGREHIALPGSSLGFHGCYRGDTKQILDLCNEKIVGHAVSHGTAYGSIMAFIRDTPYDKVIWFDSKLADCWAINNIRCCLSLQNMNNAYLK